MEVIDAFIDGERVDPEALKTALAEPAGRDYLVDVWLLREAVQAEPLREAVAPIAPIASQPRRASWWLVAAAFASALVGGYAAGQNVGRETPATDTPNPTVATSPVASPSNSPFPVPAPTRVIQLEFRSTSAASGGN